MSIKEIICKCPKCGEGFALGDALEEQAVESVRAELATLNESEVQARIEAEKGAALEQGKKLATAETLEQTKLKQKQLEEKEAELNAVKLAQVEKDSELMLLKQEKEAERIKALEQGKKLAIAETLEQTKLKQKQLEEKEAELNAVKLAQVEKDSELKRIKQQHEAAITLKLAQEKSQWEAEKASAETALKLQIQQLNDDLKKASERANQGSMQVQGEASELAIEDTLTRMFPSDDVSEVKKGHRGADCLLTVKNSIGRPVGKILFESKDTKSFASDWVPKLKDDAIVAGAQIAVLVTSAWPSDNNKTHMRDGVWVCGFHEYAILVRALRQSLTDVAKATASEEAREGKAQVMYDFLTSQEFSHTIEQMIGPIFRMHEQLQKEKRSITRLWKERETLIEGSISGTESLYMKIQGIAQVNLPPVEGMDLIEDLLNEEDGEEL